MIDIDIMGACQESGFILEKSYSAVQIDEHWLRVEGSIVDCEMDDEEHRLKKLSDWEHHIQHHFHGLFASRLSTQSPLLPLIHRTDPCGYKLLTEFNELLQISEVNDITI